MTSKKMMGVLIVAALTAAFANTARSSEMTYLLKGNFSYQVFAQQKNGEPIPREASQREFEVLSDGSAWKIRVIPVGDKTFDSFIYSYDKTNLLHYFLMLPGKAPIGILSANLENLPVPATEPFAAGEYLWLAFASGNYFKGQTNNSALAFSRAKAPNGIERRYEVPCSIVLSSTPPYLPTAIDYFTTNQTVIARDDGTLGFAPLAAPFDNAGYRSGEFKSSGFTNIQGFSLPTSFEYRGYRPKLGAEATNALDCNLIVRGMVTDVSATKTALDCSLPGKIYKIHDLRISGINANYVIEDGQIPSLEAAAKKLVHTRDPMPPMRPANKQLPAASSAPSTPLEKK